MQEAQAISKLRKWHRDQLRLLKKHELILRSVDKIDYSIAARHTKLAEFRLKLETAVVCMREYRRLGKHQEKIMREAGRNSLHPPIVTGK